jgi:hypothetical protein
LTAAAAEPTMAAYGLRDRSPYQEDQVVSQLTLPAPPQVLLLPAPSKIHYPALHEAVIEFGRKNPAAVPVRTIQAGGFFRRAISTARIGDGSKVNWVFSELGGDSNRYDGKTTQGPTTPAIYLSTDTDAAHAEGLHYSDRQKYARPAIDLEDLRANAAKWIPSKTIVTFMTTADVRLADFRMDSPEGMAFLKLLNADAAVKAALKKTPYGHILQAAQALDDYSVSRALAYIADKVIGADGVTWNTARISRNADRFSDNATLTGASKQPLAKLRPLFAQEYYEVGGKLVYIVKPLDLNINPDDFGMFPEGERVDSLPP